LPHWARRAGAELTVPADSQPADLRRAVFEDLRVVDAATVASVERRRAG